MEKFDYYTEYKNLDELKKVDSALARELAENMSDTKNVEYLNVYDDLETFADHEIVEGWYYDILNADLSDTEIYHGAPRIYDFIDLNKLGNAMTQTWDDSCHYLSENGKVVEFE